MIATPVTISLLLLLTACATSCAPFAPPTAAPDSPAPSTQLVDSAHPATGQWFFRSDEGVHAACFGAPQSECQLSIQCEAPTGTLTVAFAEAIAPDQPAAIQIHADLSSITLYAESHNEGLPTVIATMPPGNRDRPGFLLTMAEMPTRFAVEAHPLDSANTNLVRFPWHDSITRVVNACEDRARNSED